MRKIKLLMCFLCMFSVIAITSCKNEEVDTFANISDTNKSINTGYGGELTQGLIYEQIRNSQNSDITDELLKIILKGKLDFINDENKDDNDYYTLYKSYVNDKFKSTFVDSNAYKFNNEFNENLVVKYLKSEGYNIVCEQVGDNVLEEPFTCDYTDYIDKELDLEIYMKLIKVKYIIDVKSDLIDKNEGRRISYYKETVSSGSANTSRKKLEEYIQKVYDNRESSKLEDIKNVEDIAKDKRNEEIKKIDDESKKISSADDTSFTYLNKFTTCGSVRCDLEDGVKYHKDQVEKYYYSEVVIKDNTSVLYEDARKLLFSSNIEDYLYEIGSKKYLISPIFKNDENHNLNDIILFNNVSSSATYYVVEATDINSQSNFFDKADVAELLIDRISNSTVLEYYFKNSGVEIHDKDIRELFINTYGNFKGE